MAILRLLFVCIDFFDQVLKSLPLLPFPKNYRLTASQGNVTIWPFKTQTARLHWRRERANYVLMIFY